MVEDLLRKATMKCVNAIPAMVVLLLAFPGPTGTMRFGNATLTCDGMHKLFRSNQESVEG